MTPTPPKHALLVEHCAALKRGGLCILAYPPVLAEVFDKLVNLYNTGELITVTVRLRDESRVDITLTGMTSRLAGLEFTGTVPHPNGQEGPIEIKGLFGILTGGSFQLYEAPTS